jgi:outer membrane protein insertion porin family
MKRHQAKNIFHIESFKIQAKYKTDLEKVIASYKEQGYRDARIISDSISYNKEKCIIYKDKCRGRDKYYFEMLSFRKHRLFRSSLGRLLGRNL